MMNKYLTPSLLGLLLASSAANAQTTNLSTYVPTTTTVTAPLGATDYVYITQPSGTSKKLPGNTIATLVGTQTLTNKTLTSPTINAGALSGTFTGAPTLSGNIIFSGIPVMSGVITGTIASGGNLGLDVSGNVVKATVSGGSSAFSALTSSTNTTAAMLVGTGASLGASGSGTIGATSVPAAGITGTTLPAGIVTSSLTTVGTIGTGVWNSTFGGSATLASASNFGLAKVDNVTITASAGVISAVGGAATTITPGTTTIAGATAPCLIENSATTVMACPAVTAGNVTALSVFLHGSAGAQ